MAMGTGMTRRDWLRLAGGASALALLGSHGTRAAAPPRYLGAVARPDDRFAAALLSSNGAVLWETLLPMRGHGLTQRPGATELVVFARRPGTYFAVLDAETGHQRTLVPNAQGRRFYGHGVFSPDGRWLFSTENDFDRAQGVIGVYDADSAYRRVAELPSHGVGPHELRLLRDGRTLVIANGGIQTHPETGRDMLNLDAMSPSLAYVDTRDGRLLHEHRLPDGWHQLSIRHLDVTADGWVGVALQHAVENADLAPIVAVQRGDGPLRLLEAPEAAAVGWRNYGGSACFDRSGSALAVSAPHGSAITFWDVRRGRYLRAVTVSDGCGLAPTLAPDAFVATSGIGGVMEVEVGTGARRRLAPGRADALRWDNHLLEVAG